MIAGAGSATNVPFQPTRANAKLSGRRKDKEKSHLSELKQQVSEYDQKIKEQVDENEALVQENKKLNYELNEHKMAVFGLKRKCELLEYEILKLKEETDCS